MDLSGCLREENIREREGEKRRAEPQARSGRPELGRVFRSDRGHAEQQLSSGDVCPAASVDCFRVCRPSNYPY